MNSSMDQPTGDMSQNANLDQNPPSLSLNGPTFHSNVPGDSFEIEPGLYVSVAGTPDHATLADRAADNLLAPLRQFTMPSQVADYEQTSQQHSPVVPVTRSDPTHAFHPENRSYSAPNLVGQVNGEKRLRATPEGPSFPPQKRQRSAAPTDSDDLVVLNSLARRHASQPGVGNSGLDSVGPLPIDLTEDRDDDGSREPQKPSLQEVCYGMVDGVVAHATQIATPPAGVRPLHPGRNPAMKVILRVKEDANEKVVWVIDSTRQPIGRVENKFASQMGAYLASRAPLRFSARIPSEKKQANQEPGQSVCRDYKLQVTICGTRQWSKVFGKSLLENGYRLVPPNILERGMIYENAQTSLRIANTQAQPVPLSRPRQLPHQLTAQPPVQAQNSYLHQRFLGQELNGHGQTNGFTNSHIPQHSSPISDRNPDDVHRDVMSVFDTLSKRSDLPEAEPSDLVTTRLLKHQKQGLYFMQQREKPVDYEADNAGWIFKRVVSVNGSTIYRNVITGEEYPSRPPDMLGGLLADEMGLGKTLSILALCASSLDEAEDWVVAPVIQHSNMLQANPQNNGRNGLLTIEMHAKTSILVCPLSTIQNWAEQIQTHIDPAFKTYIYHGSNRIRDIKRLAEYDLIVTTYSTVASDLTSWLKGGTTKPPLERVGWFRVALDEAHQIRQSNTTNFKAMVRLKTNRRWAVTGTPIQNRLEDLGSLFSFLRLTPFYDPAVFSRFILQPFKNADPNVVPKLRVLVDSLTIRRKKNLITLPKKHDVVVELEFSQAEKSDYQVFANDAQNRAAAVTRHDTGLKGRAYMTILLAISRLRKMCAYGTAGLNDDDLRLLVGRSAAEPIDLDSDEEKDANLVSTSRALENLQLLRDAGSDLCRYCNRRVASNGSGDEPDPVLCYLTTCVGIICPSCIDEYSTETARRAGIGGGVSQCPFCSRQCHVTALKKSDVDEYGEADNGTGGQAGKRRFKKTPPQGAVPHTKTLRLVQDLMASKKWSEAHPYQAPEKSIVFSSWTTHLDLIEPSLEKAGISFTRLDGSMSLKQRTSAINLFREDASVHVILVSIYAGGLGLNLTAGSRVYVMEPQWNPQVEAQAVDRVHRLGQGREVYIIRYIMKDSFEKKVQAVQRKKQELAELSMDNKKLTREDATRQRLQDIRDLFK